MEHGAIEQIDLNRKYLSMQAPLSQLQRISQKDPVR